MKLRDGHPTCNPVRNTILYIFQFFRISLEVLVVLEKVNKNAILKMSTKETSVISKMLLVGS